MGRVSKIFKVNVVVRKCSDMTTQVKILTCAFTGCLYPIIILFYMARFIFFLPPGSVYNCLFSSGTCLKILYTFLTKWHMQTVQTTSPKPDLISFSLFAIPPLNR